MEFAPFVITGNQNFDYYFSLVFVFGMLSVGPSLLFKLMKW